MNTSEDDVSEDHSSHAPHWIQPFMVPGLQPASMQEAVSPERWNLVLANKGPSSRKTVLSKTVCHVGDHYFLYEPESLWPVHLPNPSSNSPLIPLFDDSVQNRQQQPYFPAMSYSLIPSTPGRYSRYRLLLSTSEDRSALVWVDPEEAGIPFDQLFSPSAGAWAINCICVAVFNAFGIEVPVYEVFDVLPDSPFKLGNRIYDLKHRQRYGVVVLQIEVDPRFSYYLCVSAERTLFLLRVLHRDTELDPILIVKVEVERRVRLDDPDPIRPDYLDRDARWSFPHPWDTHDFMPCLGINARLPHRLGDARHSSESHGGTIEPPIANVWWSSKAPGDPKSAIPYAECWGLLGLEIENNVAVVTDE